MHNTLITFDKFVDKFMATEPVLLSSCVVGLVLRVVDNAVVYIRIGNGSIATSLRPM